MFAWIIVNKRAPEEAAVTKARACVSNSSQLLSTSAEVIFDNHQRLLAVSASISIIILHNTLLGLGSIDSG